MYISTCVCKCACDILQLHGETTMGTMWHKTQNKETGPTDSINSSWEFHGSSSPCAASVLIPGIVPHHKYARVGVKLL